MPVSIEKEGSGYRVSTPHGVKAKHTTKAKAKAQERLLNAVDHGWHPTGESVAAFVSNLLEHCGEPGCETDEEGQEHEEVEEVQIGQAILKLIPALEGSEGQEAQDDAVTTVMQMAERLVIIHGAEPITMVHQRKTAKHDDDGEDDGESYRGGSPGYDHAAGYPD